MRILGVDVRAYLMSCCITMPLTVALVYFQMRDVVLGLELGLAVAVLSFFIIAFIESTR